MAGSDILGSGSRPAGGTWSRRSVLLAGGGLLLAGCAEPDRPSIESQEVDASPTSKLRAVLERRTRALADGDEAGYLADLDPSNKDLIERERLVFANLTQFEFDDLRYLTTGMTDHPDGESTLIHPVTRVVKLTADAGPGEVAPAESFSFRVADRGGRFVVTDIVPATRESMEKLRFAGPDATAPWHFDKLRVVRASGDVWLAADDTVRDLDRFVDATGQELDFVQKLWGDRRAFPGHVLFFTRDAGNFKRWFDHGTADNFNPEYLGIQVPLLGVKKDGQYFQGQYAGSRIVVNLASIEAADSTPSRTIRHELAHAVSARARLTGGAFTAPTWAIEGFARYTETIGDPSRANAVRAIVGSGVRAGRFHGRPPSDKDFYGGNIGYNYSLGATVFLTAERIGGREAAVELYATAIDATDAGGQFLEYPRFDSISRRIFGIAGSAFRDQWLNSVRNGG